MKFNKEICISQIEDVRKVWREAAMKYSMEYGVHIEINIITDGRVFAQAIEFKIGERSFGSLKELRRALKLKSFL